MKVWSNKLSATILFLMKLSLSFLLLERFMMEIHISRSQACVKESLFFLVLIVLLIWVFFLRALLVGLFLMWGFHQKQLRMKLKRFTFIAIQKDIFVMQGILMKIHGLS